MQKLKQPLKKAKKISKNAVYLVLTPIAIVSVAILIAYDKLSDKSKPRHRGQVRW